METDKLEDGSAATDIPGLVAQARAAYQLNRIKECLALTRAALLVDPGNTAALEIQSSVRFDMQRDLSDARALIEESRNKPEGQKYRKAAEIILLKALYLDPDSEGAKTLLSSIRSFTETPVAVPVPVPVAAPAPVPVEAPIAEPVPVPVEVAASEPTPLTTVAPAVPEASEEMPEIELTWEPPATSRPELKLDGFSPSYITKQELPDPDPLPFTTGTMFEQKPVNTEKKKANLTVPVIVVAIAVIGGGLMLARQHLGTVQNAATASTSASSETTPSRSTAYPASGAATPSNTIATATNTAQPKQTLATFNAPPLPGIVPVVNAAAAANPRTPAATATGSLAVSSPIAAEIYLGDKYLGATPTTLQLPAGNQTLEYRHGDLRSVLTHVVKANETTTALVTFDVNIVLQAKPWANVFVEGSTRVPLGTTPVSDVKLPIGTVLVFENPNFPSKSHKIAADDKTVQVVFQ